MIGKNISNIRKKKGITLSEAAERANISKSYLSNIERNLNQNPSIHIVEKIADALDVDLRTILGSKATSPIPEHEWIEFINELKKSGVEKDKLHEYKTVIEFAKWQQEQYREKQN